MELHDLLKFKRKEILDIIANKERYYISYSIKKRNGKARIIDAPQDKLKEIQRSILYNILYKYKPHSIAHGFVYNKSPKTNAQVHVGCKTLLMLDIVNFFNSIKKNIVIKTLKNLLKEKFSKQDISILGELLTFKNRIPQGAITSPALSNLIMLETDYRLNKLAIMNNAKITRYSDDMAISFEINLQNEIITSIIHEIRKYLIEIGLRINPIKIKVRRHYHRMKVTGIIINEKLNIPRKTWRNFRAYLHNILRDNRQVNQKELQQIRGYIEWVKMINPNRGKQFLVQYEKILTLLKPVIINPTISKTLA